MPTDPQRPDPAAFAKRLKLCLTANGYDERGAGKRLAEEFDVKPPVVSDWRKGRYLPTASRVRAMAALWQVPYDWLYWGEGPGPNFAPPPSPKADKGHARSKQTERAIDDLRVAVSALYALVAARSSVEAESLAKAMKKHLPADSLQDSLLTELLSVLAAGAERAQRRHQSP